MQKYDADDLLFSSGNSDRFIDKISLSEADKSLLKACRKKVRDKIRKTFQEIKGTVNGQSAHRFLVEASISSEDKKMLAKVTPKFKPQGSSVYGTLNYPAHIPPQQMDIDDGVYLPMSIIKETPVIKKNIFFDIIDGALEELRKEEGWKEVVHKNTCARVTVNQSLHIDVPLYAIPDERFNQMISKASMNESMQAMDAANFDDIWLDQSEVYIAVRDQEHWKLSDPAKIQKWFEQESSSAKFGDRLVRVCRYLKAWRDYTWKTGGPSSITLMICVWETFRSNKMFESDSEALLKVVDELASKLGGIIINPGDNSSPPEEVYPRKISPQDQKDFQQKAGQLATNINNALQRALHAEEVVQHFTLTFGRRIPQRPELINIIPVASSVRKQQKIPQPRPDDMARNLQSG